MLSFLKKAATGCSRGTDSAESSSLAKRRKLERRTTPLVPPEQYASTAVADDFHSGAHLAKFAQRCVSFAVSHYGRPARNDKIVRIGGACSGSEALAVAVDSVQTAFEAEEVPMSINIAFAMEVEEQKLNWCRDVHKVLGHSACAFNDLRMVGNGFAGPDCAVHGRKCNPGLLDGLVVGFSCKDFSKAATTSKVTKGAGNQKHILASSSSPGKSADTLHGTIRLIDQTSPDWLLLENVDAIAENCHNADMELLFACLASRGYDVKMIVLDSAEYSLPQHRERAYIIGIRRPGRLVTVTSAECFFAQVENMMALCKMAPPQLGSILLPDSHPLVQEELQRRTDQPEPRGWDTNTINAHRAAWLKLGLRWQASQAREEDRQSEWFQTLPLRERDILALHQHVAVSEKSSKAEQDARQAALVLGNSCSFTSQGILGCHSTLVSPTAMPKAKCWISLGPGNTHYDAATGPIHRYMLGPEAMMLQGWPILADRYEHIRQQRSNLFLNDLAGNAFPVTIIAAFINAILFALEPKSGTPDDQATITDASDVNSAMLLFSGS
jgi:site-specific DNA-cytosine methylase